MTCLFKVLVLQRYYTPLLVVANLVGVSTFVIPMFPKGPTILAGVSLGLFGEFLKTGRQRVASVFLVEHRGHVVRATGVSGSVVDGHGSGHGHIDWFGNGNGYW